MAKKKHKAKIILTGGGTGGSVSPLLAVADEVRNEKIEARSSDIYHFLWIGTIRGIEREMIKKEGIKFRAICSGKLRRYFSIKNFIDPFLIIIGFFQALAILIVWRPKLVVSAGSFVSVPVVWAAWILRIPILIHQQDVRPGLANKLTAPFAKNITVTFEKSLKNYGKKAVWTGNPVRFQIFDPSASEAGFRPANPAGRLPIEKIREKFDLDKHLPVVLVVGGGTGAMTINELVGQSIDELIKICQIIHITGRSKKLKIKSKKYLSFEFLDVKKMAEVLQVADVAVSRCGLGLLTELSYLGKPAILIPIPNSHQEDNAQVFKEKQAAIVLDQKKLTSEILVSNIKRLLDDNLLRSKLRNNIRDVIKKGANKRIVDIIKRITRNV